VVNFQIMDLLVPPIQLCQKIKIYVARFGTYLPILWLKINIMENDGKAYMWFWVICIVHVASFLFKNQLRIKSHVGNYFFKKNLNHWPKNKSIWYLNCSKHIYSVNTSLWRAQLTSNSLIVIQLGNSICNNMREVVHHQLRASQD
jgi:hypothetical protein